MHQLNESDGGLIKGNFVNTSVLRGLFKQNRVCRCLGLASLHTCQAMCRRSLFTLLSCQ